MKYLILLLLLALISCSSSIYDVEDVTKAYLYTEKITGGENRYPVSVIINFDRITKECDTVIKITTPMKGSFDPTKSGVYLLEFPNYQEGEEIDILVKTNTTEALHYWVILRHNSECKINVLEPKN